MLAKDVGIRDVAKAIGALRRTLPRVARPLQELKIVSDGRRVVVRAPGGEQFEPTTGQLVLDFNVETLRSDVVRVLRPGSAAGRAKTAYELYTRASALDEDSANVRRGRGAFYVRALQLDPELAIAYTNLGNMSAFVAEMKNAPKSCIAARFRSTIVSPKAHYNLGYVMLERGFMQKKRRTILDRALSAIRVFSDAHFTLAMALEQLGDSTTREDALEALLEARAVRHVGGHRAPAFVDAYFVRMHVSRRLRTRLGLRSFRKTTATRDASLQLPLRAACATLETKKIVARRTRVASSTRALRFLDREDDRRARRGSSL